MSLEVTENTGIAKRQESKASIDKDDANLPEVPEQELEESQLQKK